MTKTKYPIILCGDHAAFEIEWEKSGRPDHERPDWPLPSFDARVWAEAFCKHFLISKRNHQTEPINGDDIHLMTTWFANALMRGYDQKASEKDG